MIEIARADDAVRLSWLRAVLEEAGVAYAVFDEGVQRLWPGAFRARLMVADRDAWIAGRTVEAADAERLAGS